MYEKQTWATGDVITEEKLNHIEDGISTSGALVVHEIVVDGTVHTLDKTWNEIKNAIMDGSGAVMSIETVDENMTMYSMAFLDCFTDGSQYTVNNNNNVRFKTNSPDGYPSYTEGGGGHN